LFSIRLPESLVTTHLVPLVTCGGSKEHKIIIGAPTFDESKCGATPRLLKSLKTQLEDQLPASHQAQNLRTCSGRNHQVLLYQSCVDGVGGFVKRSYDNQAMY